MPENARNRRKVFYFSLSSYVEFIEPTFSKQSFDEMRKMIDWVLQNDGIAVCVCDADITRENNIESQKLKDMKVYYASNNKVFICDSMPSIEFWFLLHYLETSRFFRDSAEVATTLRRYLPAFQKHSTFLEKPQWVTELCADNKLHAALSRAKVLGQTPQVESYSNVYKAIELFSDDKID